MAAHSTSNSPIPSTRKLSFFECLTWTLLWHYAWLYSKFKWNRFWWKYKLHLNIIYESLTIRGPCIVNLFWYICISNKMQRYTFYLFLETALHISGGISTHNQEHTQQYFQYLILVKPLLLPADIVEEFELVWVWCRKCINLFCAVATAPKQINTIPTPHSKQFQLFHNSGR